jgi:hypothetical protein
MIAVHPHTRGEYPAILNLALEGTTFTYCLIVSSFCVKGGGESPFFTSASPSKSTSSLVLDPN